MNLQPTSAALEKVMFLYKFIRTPKTIGSVTPSSRFLTSKMIDSIPWSDVTAVAELGAGTGVVTKAIQQAVKPGSKVLVFERDTHLRHPLQAQFPEFSVYSDACSLYANMRKQGLESLDCIISGLPFANFPQTTRDAIMEQIVKSLKPGGLFVAFQYSLQMKSQLSRYFDIESIQFVLLNVPPAFVYVCRKKQ